MQEHAQQDTLLYRPGWKRPAPRLKRAVRRERRQGERHSLLRAGRRGRKRTPAECLCTNEGTPPGAAAVGAVGHMTKELPASRL